MTVGTVVAFLFPNPSLSDEDHNPATAGAAQECTCFVNTDFFFIFLVKVVYFRGGLIITLRKNKWCHFFTDTRPFLGIYV
jgi:hypothetical protein